MLKLLPGEEIKFETDSCIVMNGKSFTETTTIFTNFRFVFEEIHIPWLLIEKLECNSNCVEIYIKFSPSSFIIQFKSSSCANLIVKEDWIVSKVIDFMKEQIDPPKGLSSIFAFKYALGINKFVNDIPHESSTTYGSQEFTKKDYLGWEPGFNWLNEFKRLKFNPKTWCVLSLDKEQTISPTYPNKCFFLKSALGITNEGDKIEYDISELKSDSKLFLKNLISFRGRGRFPMATWKNPYGETVLLRASQPLVGILGSRCYEDELLFRNLLSSINSSKKSSLVIFDARGYASALGNSSTGGGYINTDNYPSSSILFMGLANIHAVAASHDALMRALRESFNSPSWPSILETTGWLNHVTSVLKAVCGENGLLQKVLNDQTEVVLIHCSDGWDRTSQCMALIQLLVDPFYRTIEGFRILIEKEFVSLGHPFASRSKLPVAQPLQESDIATIHKEVDEELRQPFVPFDVSSNVISSSSPIFLLFITCVHHLIQQFPTSFEFDNHLLLFIIRNAFSGLWGDFICNFESERAQYHIRNRTRSMWGWIQDHRLLFKNPAYEDRTNFIPISTSSPDDIRNWWKEKAVLRPEISTNHILLWHQLYFPDESFSSPNLIGIPPYFLDMENIITHSFPSKLMFHKTLNSTRKINQYNIIFPDSETKRYFSDYSKKFSLLENREIFRSNETKTFSLFRNCFTSLSPITQYAVHSIPLIHIYSIWGKLMLLQYLLFCFQFPFGLSETFSISISSLRFEHRESRRIISTFFALWKNAVQSRWLSDFE